MANDETEPNIELVDSKEKYEQKFGETKQKSKADETSKNSLPNITSLTVALEKWNFELNLYWKRTAYFWAFIISSYTAYFAVFNLFVTKIKNTDCLECFVFPAKLALLAISFLCMMFSVAWHFCNKGSKFWQENWEKHVDLLHQKEIGPVLSIMKSPLSGSILNPFESYNFSVSKVNMFLSFLVSVFSIAFFCCNFCLLFQCFPRSVRILISVAISLVAVSLFIFFTRGNRAIAKKMKAMTKKMVYSEPDL